MNFVAIDVETANNKTSSICQIGVAVYREGCLTDEWKTYINPNEPFTPFNIRVHGIRPSAVANAPVISEVSSKLYSYLDDTVTVSHTHFDKTSITQALTHNNLRDPNCTWLDSCKVARRTWDKQATGGFGLSRVCRYLGYDFKHHDALEDAKAAGYIIIKAIEETGLTIEELVMKYCK